MKQTKIKYEKVTSFKKEALAKALTLFLTYPLYILILSIGLFLWPEQTDTRGILKSNLIFIFFITSLQALILFFNREITYRRIRDG